MVRRVKQQINRAALAGHNRYCALCKRMVSTHKGKYAQHGDCPNSGEKVPK